MVYDFMINELTCHTNCLSSPESRLNLTYSIESAASSYEALQMSFMLAEGSKGMNKNVVPMMTKVKIKLENAETSESFSTEVFSEQHS